MFKKKGIVNIEYVLHNYYKKSGFMFLMNNSPKINSLKSTSFISEKAFEEHGSVGWEYLLITMMSESLYSESGILSMYEIKLIVKHLQRIISRSTADKFNTICDILHMYYKTYVIKLFGCGISTSDMRQALIQMYTVRTLATMIYNLAPPEYKQKINAKLINVSLKNTMHDILEETPYLSLFALYDKDWYKRLIDLEYEVEISPSVTLDCDTLFSVICSIFDTIRPCGPRSIIIEREPELNHLLQYSKFTPDIIKHLLNTNEGFYNSDFCLNTVIQDCFIGNIKPIILDSKIKNHIDNVCMNTIFSMEPVDFKELNPYKLLSSSCNIFKMRHIALEMERCATKDWVSDMSLAEYKAIEIVINYFDGYYQIWGNYVNNKYLNDKEHYIFGKCLNIIPEIYTWITDYVHLNGCIIKNKYPLGRVVTQFNGIDMDHFTNNFKSYLELFKINQKY